ncbi:BspA family leucine-rich repeat surface protein, partial [Companilactobacillus nantensis]|uniref:BspA family leucine-rich repeat surface protein n=1 Tax=Companilactobacillus nantensis TaxID=305793 RepID=UPI0011BFD2B1
MRFRQSKHNPNTVVRKRLVKSKKNWVVATGISFAGGLLMLAVPEYVIKADTISTTTSATSTTVSSAAEPHNVTASSNNASISPTSSLTTDNGRVETSSTDATPQNSSENIPAKNTKSESDNTISKENGVTKPVNEENGTVLTTSKDVQSISDTKISNVKTGSTSSQSKSEIQNPQLRTESNLETKVGKDKVTPGTVDSDDKNISGSEHETGDAVVINSSSSDKGIVKKANSGNGWVVVDDGKTLKLTGSIDKGTEVYHERWGGHTQTITKINVAVPIEVPENSSYLFANMTNLTQIDNISNLKTENITNAEGMFKNDKSLKNLDLSAHTMQSAHNISHMFENDTKLKQITFHLSHFIRIVDGSYAFANNTSLQKLSLPVSNSKKDKEISATQSWKARSATDLRAMFKNDDNLNELDIVNWQFSNADTGDSYKGEGMFDGTNLKSITLIGWLKFGKNTALTSKRGALWTNKKDENGNPTEGAYIFSGIPNYVGEKKVNSLGELYNGKYSSLDILEYTASNKINVGELNNNLVTIPTDQGNIIINVEGTVGQQTEVGVPDEWTFNGVNYKKETSAPSVVTTELNQTTAKVNEVIHFVKKNSEIDKPVIPEEPSITGQPEIPEQPNIPDQSETPKQPNITGQLGTSEGPNVTGQAETSEKPNIPGSSETSEQPGITGQPGTSKRPNVTGQAETPEQPNVSGPSVEPNIPDSSETPEKPSITGQPGTSKE